MLSCFSLSISLSLSSYVEMKKKQKERAIDREARVRPFNCISSFGMRPSMSVCAEVAQS